MISYRPLAELLKKRKMTLRELEVAIGHKGGTLRQSLNAGKYITTGTLDKICSFLKCDIKSVISWRDGEQKEFSPVDTIKVDMERLREAIVEKGSLREMSLRLGKNENYLYQLMKKDEMKKRKLVNICEVLGLNYKM